MAPEQLEILLNSPSLKPPPGTTSNLVNPPNHVVLGYFDISICLVLSTIAIMIRMLTRIWIMHKFDLADREILASESHET